jgi:hypothetical protein
MHYVPALPTDWNRLLLLSRLQKSVHDENLGGCVNILTVLYIT